MFVQKVKSIWLHCVCVSVSVCVCVCVYPKTSVYTLTIFTKNMNNACSFPLFVAKHVY